MSKSSKVKKKPIDLNTWDYVPFIKNELRKSFKRSPLYGAARSAAKEEYFIPAKNGNMMRRVHFKCASCGRFFREDEGKGIIAVDHIDPVEPIDREIEIDEYCERLYCGLGGLQVLCNYKGLRDDVKSCHGLKTVAENKARRAFKKGLKK